MRLAMMLVLATAVSVCGQVSTNPIAQRLPALEAMTGTNAYMPGAFCVTSMWNFVVEAKNLTREEREAFNAQADTAMRASFFGYGGVQQVGNQVRALDSYREGVKELEALKRDIVEAKKWLEQIRKDRAEGNPMGMDFDKAYPAYAKGVNAALDALMLLDLELKMKGEKKTWGEMAEVVRTRLGVKEDKR